MAIYKRGNVWWVDVYVGSGNRRRRVRQSTGCTEKVQARIVEQSMTAVNRGITSRQRAQDILDNVLPIEERGVPVADSRAFYEGCTKREGLQFTALEYQKRLNAISRMAEWALANTRAKLVGDITPEIAWAYSCFIAERGITVKTRNNEIGHLRSAWKTFEKYGKTDSNPWTLARAARNRSEERHGRAFSSEEIDRILEASRESGCEWEGVVTVALYTGLRKRDIECLRWSGDPDESVIADMSGRRIYGTPAKTSRKGVKVNVPMHEKVFALLSHLPKDGEFVFPWRQSHPNGQRPKKGDVFFSSVLARAGISAAEKEKVSFHSLRHTFITRLAEAGVAEDVRMRLAGHTNAATHEVYTHGDTQSRKAIEGLE